MQKKTISRMVSFLMALIMVFSLLPLTAFANEAAVDVYISVENTTFLSPENDDTPAWTGVLLEPYKVTVPVGTTVMEATVIAFEENNITEHGSGGNYIDDINGLKAFDGTFSSGWMITINDWFIDAGAGDYTAEDGDIICWMFTMNGYGADIGGDFNNDDKSLAALNISDGVLAPQFGSDVTDYTLTIPDGVSGVLITPTAANKNFQVRTSVDGTEYKRMREVPVSDGTVISIVCGDPEWPTMNWGSGDIPAVTYTITVETEHTAPADPIDVNVTFQYENGFLAPLLPGYTISVTPGIAELYGYNYDADLIADTDVSVLDVLVASHIEALGGDELLLDCLEVSETGYVTTVLGEATTAFGFLVNSEMPHGSEWRSEDVEYLGYSCNQAVVTSGDTVDFFIYYDDSFFTDYFTWFEQDGAKVDDITVTAGQAFDVCLYGYIAMYGLYTDEIKSDFTEPVADAQIGILDSSTGEIIPIASAFTDDDGIVSITISEPGTYILSAIGDEWVPIISPYVTVVVTAAPDEREEPVTLPELQSDWNSARGNRRNMGVVNAETPTGADDAELLWSIKYGSGYFDTPNTPVIVEGNLIFAAGSKIFKVDRTNGEIIAQNSMVSSPSFNISSVTYGGGMVFTTVSNGRIQAFNADTLESLWVSEPLGGQALSHIVYADGYVYTGYWTSETKDNYYICMSVTDEDPENAAEVKEALWKHTVAGGFYWTGGVVIGDYIVFGSDNGTADKEDLSRLYSLDRITGEVIDICDGVIGDQRSGIAYDSATDALYFTSKAGYVGRVRLDGATGEFIDESLIVRQMNPGWEATGTPVVHDGILFVGTGAGVGGGGKLVAANAETLEILDNVDLIAYPQGSPLLSTAYEQETGKLYLYITYNKTPGGLTVVQYDTATKKLSACELFTPPSGTQNYCIDSVICGTDGTLYYHNDSTYLFAIGKKAAEPEPEPEPETLITEIAAQRAGADISLSPYGTDRYAATVDNSCDSIDILVSVVSGASVTVNGKEPVNDKVSIALTAGVSNTVTIIATKNTKTETVTLFITRKAAPETPGGGDDRFGTKIGTVSISMRNDTFPGGAFTGLLFSNPSFDLYSNDTMMTVVLRALKANGYSWKGTGGDGSAEDYKIAYLASISKGGMSLGEFDGDPGSGWMGLLNDFFVHEGFGQFIPEDGDEISIEYTQNLGADLGGSWGNTSTALRSLSFSAGTLSPAFSSETYEYVLTLPAGSASVKVTPHAYNRNFLVKTFLNEKVTSNNEGSSFYKRTASVPVKAGDTIFIGVGEPAWPSMNNQSGEASGYAATWYRVKINVAGEDSGNTNAGGAGTSGGSDAPLGGLPEITVVELPANIKDNIMTVTITDELAELLAENAALNSNFFNERTVVIEMPDTGASGVAAYKAAVPAAEAAAFKDSAVFVSTPAGNTILPASLVNKFIAEGRDLVITIEKGSMIVSMTLGGVDIQPKNYGEYVRLEIPMELDSSQNPDMAVMVKITDETRKIIGTSYFGYGYVIASINETGTYDALYNEKSFTDTTGKWMDKAVLYMASRDIISGVGNNLYDPNRAITRAEFASLLVRTLEAMGVELKAEGQNFADIGAGKWYSDVILKARAAGLVSGVGDNLFAPDTTITRQDMFTMLYRAMDKYGLLGKYPMGEAASFADSALVAGYAREAVDALTSRGLVSGKGNDTVAPKEISTRAECAQVLYNILCKQ